LFHHFKSKIMEPKNKIALVTGSSRGLGKNMALSLANKGIDVIITYHSKKDEAEAVVKEIEQLGQKAAALQLDVSNVKAFDSFIANVSQLLNNKWGATQFNYLVNNAGIDRYSKFEDTTEEAFDELFNTHFKGVYFLTQKALPLIADGGSIVNLSTGLTRFATPGYAAYASMKGAINTLTQYLAKELGPRGINVNAVAPGITDTDFTQHALSQPGLREFMNANTALGRVGKPGDIGGIVAFLCSDDAHWITAQRIEASGGLFI
jgi:NAD(P)-dependent dehydrogenase (short-subunit alcohol dehydrogenase family)